MLEERRQALERELGTAKTVLKSGQISLEDNILENLQRQLEVTLKVDLWPQVYFPEEPTSYVQQKNNNYTNQPVFHKFTLQYPV